MLRRRLVVLASALVGLALGVSGCTLPTGDDGGGYGPSQASKTNEEFLKGYAKANQQAPPTALKSGVPTVLKVKGGAWTPARYVVAPGADVALKVVNRDASQHNFTLEGEELSKNLPSKGQMLLEFAAPGPGKHRFYCKYHRQEMQGWITVQ